MIQEERCKFHTDLYLGGIAKKSDCPFRRRFVNLEEAYNFFHRDILWRTLRKYELLRMILKVAQELVSLFTDKVCAPGPKSSFGFHVQDIKTLS